MRIHFKEVNSFIFCVFFADLFNEKDDNDRLFLLVSIVQQDDVCLQRNIYIPNARY